MNRSAKALIERRLGTTVREIDKHTVGSMFGPGVVSKMYADGKPKVKPGQLDCGDPPGTSLGIEFVNGTVIIIYNSEWMTVEKISK